MRFGPSQVLFLLSMVMRYRGYVWEPDRNEDEDNKEFITFIAQVEGLSAVPDGRIYMNAYIDAIKGKINIRVQNLEFDA